MSTIRKSNSVQGYKILWGPIWVESLERPFTQVPLQLRHVRHRVRQVERGAVWQAVAHMYHLSRY